MEKSDIVSNPFKYLLGDVGSFDALFEELPKDKNQNTKMINI